ncbi:hypothetical protein BKA67DRAFT_580444 [Truncatella angustata]|uniref:Uncharacterized protein n=1 Tax=Truncatella angustata TaxID=152316 RepID=A0A9P8RP29_9PEZI|nr:uncharacterized protein BKA67DRAFT_580444 [Truncatella angustata]KAH6646750.1 hypothetical protein BKA67DRAFT_580444 [Truncatella angustata]
MSTSTEAITKDHRELKEYYNRVIVKIAIISPGDKLLGVTIIFRDLFLRRGE